ncbi:MAG TPA: tol-pal system protein YbgF [Burkholderiaceae bacterium]|nr:tol-pal system protein YbgF [Burkholderiaceae bacterium]
MTHPRSGFAAPPQGGNASGPAKPVPRRLLGWQLGVVVVAFSFALPVRAQLFPDNEARKAIIELRATDEQQKKELAALAATNKDLAEQLAQIKRSLLDLNNQLEQLRAELARQRGGNEQLARDVAEVQRRQKDIAQGVDERMRRVEPQRVTVDGKEFVAEPEEKRQYEEAFASIRSGDFLGTTLALQAFLRRWPESGYADSARFWLGNALYGKRDLKEAAATFRAFIAAAPPANPRVPEAMLALANCQAELKDAKGARATLAELLKKYPQSEAAAAGKERLAAIK